MATALKMPPVLSDDAPATVIGYVAAKTNDSTCVAWWTVIGGGARDTNSVWSCWTLAGCDYCGVH
jgi:hypothetical protein